MLASVLMLMAAGVVGLLGAVHMLYTFRGTKLLPRDPALITRMRAISPVITARTSMWQAWVGFNASHSLGAIGYALFVGYFAWMQPQLLFASPFLLVVVLVMLLTYLGLAIRYWFRIPLIGVVVALICASAAVVVSRFD